MIALAAVVSAATALATPLAAQPRSAIPWLSESLRPEAVPPPSRPPETARPPVRGTEEITVTALGEPSRNGVGLLPPEESGLPRDLWGPTSAADAADAIRAHPARGVPAARALFHRMLVAETDPPRESTPEAAVLVARLDRLLEIGALEDARSLIERAGPKTPALFRRWFDIGVLTNASGQQCEALHRNPALSPTLPARVFCLARGGDWNAAEITVTLGEDVGSIDPASEELIARFLDPEIFEGVEPPPPPDPLTPLDFLMREAVGLPRPSGPLPLAFLHHDLDPHQPMRMRVEAAERLALSGGVAPPVLFAAYRAGTPAASGGLWDRAERVQALDAALDEGGPDAVGEALKSANDALAERGLRVPFATAYAGRLADLDPEGFPPDARALLTELLLLGGASDAAARFAAEPDADTLLAAAGSGGVAAPQPQTELERAALAGIAGHAAPDDREQRLRALLDEGRTGEAILGALDLLSGGPDADPPSLATALAVLVRAGQEPAARAIAVETLLLAGGDEVAQ